MDDLAAREVRAGTVVGRHESTAREADSRAAERDRHLDELTLVAVHVTFLFLAITTTHSSAESVPSDTLTEKLRTTAELLAGHVHRQTPTSWC